MATSQQPAPTAAVQWKKLVSSGLLGEYSQDGLTKSFCMVTVGEDTPAAKASTTKNVTKGPWASLFASPKNTEQKANQKALSSSSSLNKREGKKVNYSGRGLDLNTPVKSADSHEDKKSRLESKSANGDGTFVPNSQRPDFNAAANSIFEAVANGAQVYSLANATSTPKASAKQNASPKDAVSSLQTKTAESCVPQSANSDAGSSASENSDTPAKTNACEISHSKQPAVPFEQLTEHRIQQRERQVKLGKATEGYKNFCNVVAASTTIRGDPQAPNPRKPCSKRAFDGLCKYWRRELHRFDDWSKCEEMIAERKSMMSTRKENQRNRRQRRSTHRTPRKHGKKSTLLKRSMSETSTPPKTPGQPAALKRSMSMSAAPVTPFVLEEDFPELSPK